MHYLCIMIPVEPKYKSPSTNLESEVKRVVECSGAKRLLIGVSGGADSTALLAAITNLGIDCIAVHCNFHLRGDESMRDQNFTESLCKSLHVPLHIIDFDVADYMRTHDVSTEMACRNLRYAEFLQIMHSEHCDRISVAHNSDDNAETLFLNLMRGTGVTGLRGMLPDTGEILRPLLNINRQEILEYLHSRNLTYITDSSNLQSDFRRNYLRNDILPLLEQRWPGVRKALQRTIANMRQEELVLNFTEKQFLSSDTTSLPYSTIKRAPDALWLIHRFSTRFGASAGIAQEILNTITSVNVQSGKWWRVPQGRIIAERDALEFIADNDSEFKFEIIIEEFQKGTINPDDIYNSGNNILWTTLNPENIIFRHHIPGDRIDPIGMNGSTPVSKIFKDAKMSQHDKETIIIAEQRNTGRILWIEGLKRSRYHLIQPHSEIIYKISVKK